MQTTNLSGLVPLGRAVLLREYAPERKTSVIIIPDSVKANMQSVENRAVVVECGPECWREEREPRARPGDRVMVAKFSGHLATGPADGKLYRIVNDRDIFTAITHEE